MAVTVDQRSRQLSVAWEADEDAASTRWSFDRDFGRGGRHYTATCQTAYSDPRQRPAGEVFSPYEQQTAHFQ